MEVEVSMSLLCEGLREEVAVLREHKYVYLPVRQSEPHRRIVSFLCSHTMLGYLRHLDSVPKAHRFFVLVADVLLQPPHCEPLLCIREPSRAVRVIRKE